MEQPAHVAQAVADLAEQTGLDASAIEVVSHEEVTWRDGSLGCPQRGRFYTQALVEGYRIHLRAGGRDVHFHGAHGRPPLRCDHPDPDGAMSTGSPESDGGPR
jgi:hypothetical protein